MEFLPTKMKELSRYVYDYKEEEMLSAYLPTLLTPFIFSLGKKIPFEFYFLQNEIPPLT